MPNRILRESICTSEDIERLTPIQEVAFYRVLVQCDDFGRLDARPAILKARLFPLKDISVAEMGRILAVLAECGLVTLYSWERRDYLQVTNWLDHQRLRNKRARYPGPDGWQPQGGASLGQQLAVTDDPRSIDSNSPRIAALNPNPNPNPKQNPNPDPVPAPVHNEQTCAVDFAPVGDGSAPASAGEQAPVGEDAVCADLAVSGCAFSLRGGQVYELGPKSVAAYCAAYPGADVPSELRRAALWLKASVRPPGTPGAMATFVAHWLRQAEDRARAPAEKVSKSATFDPARDYAQRQYPPGFFDAYFADLSAPIAQEGALP